MTMLEHINGPEDLKQLSQDQLGMLASEIREFLVESVTTTSGHLGPNLGVVELTIALHLVFDSPKDKLVFDTGHQSYVHKLLTGRHDGGGNTTCCNTVSFRGMTATAGACAGSTGARALPLRDSWDGRCRCRTPLPRSPPGAVRQGRPGR
jgi:hypothetical protein